MCPYHVSKLYYELEKVQLYRISSQKSAVKVGFRECVCVCRFASSWNIRQHVPAVCEWKGMLCVCSGYRGRVAFVGPLVATDSDWGTVPLPVGVDSRCRANTPGSLIGRERRPIRGLLARSVLLVLARPQRAHSLAPRINYSIWISAPMRHSLPVFPLVSGFVARRKDARKYEPVAKCAGFHHERSYRAVKKV